MHLFAERKATLRRVRRRLEDGVAANCRRSLRERTSLQRSNSDRGTEFALTPPPRIY